MSKITFIIKDSDGTFTAQNGWHWLGGWRASENNLKVWKTFKGVLRAVKNEFPNHCIVVTNNVPD